MPVFSRRRLQAMLDDLSDLLNRGKAADLIARLRSKRTGQTLAAEIELGLTWAIRQVSEVEIEPDLDGTSARLDTLAMDLFPSSPAVVEITAISDDSFSGRDDMEKVASKLAQCANGVRRGVGRHLHFAFAEATESRDGKPQRVRRVPHGFDLEGDIRSQFEAWLLADDGSRPRSIRLSDEELDVVVTWSSDQVHPESRVFCSMPAVAYDLEDNVLFKALQGKARQLSDVPGRYLKCVFVGDAGCYLLRRKSIGVGDAREVSADDIVNHFVSTQRVDIVCVFSPFTDWTARSPSSPRWDVSIRDRRDLEVDDNEYDNLRRLCGVLPTPHYESYRARSLHRQGVFDPQGQGHYLGTEMTCNAGSDILRIRMSTRLLQEYLAGRLTYDQFDQWAFGGGIVNQFEHQLSRGNVIVDTRFEAAGLDDDDDYIVFELATDPAASSLEVPIVDGSELAGVLLTPVWRRVFEFWRRRWWNR